MVAYRPDLVTVDKDAQEGLVIDMVITNGSRMVERERIDKYQNLPLEI